MFIFQCSVCKAKLSADEGMVGQLVRCPTCNTTLRVPAARPAPAAVGAGAMSPSSGSRSESRAGGTTTTAPPPPMTGVGGLGFRTGGKRFGFNCGYCSSRLEATEAQCAQEGQCPTCGNNITIPILDRYGRLIDPHTREIIKQDPHPVHAYAAAGDRAPKIQRLKDGSQAIQCPRCSTLSPVTANNCKSCGMPFTMEGTTLEAAGTSNGFCVASLVLGIIGIPAACSIIPAVLAIIFGIVGYNQVNKTASEGGGKGMAIAGIICGVIGLILGAMWLGNL